MLTDTPTYTLTSGSDQIKSMFVHLHKSLYLHRSPHPRNILVQPGPLAVPPAQRSLARPSFRIIDFGRTERSKHYGARHGGGKQVGRAFGKLAEGNVQPLSRTLRMKADEGWLALVSWNLAARIGTAHLEGSHRRADRRVLISSISVMLWGLHSSLDSMVSSGLPISGPKPYQKLLVQSH